MGEIERRQVRVWLIMALLTLAAIPIGHATSADAPGALLIAALLAMAFAKSALLLAHYLGLRASPGWNRGLRAGIALLLMIILGLTFIAKR